MSSINPAGWNERDSQDNALATATRAAVPNKTHVVFGISASFSAATASKLVQIKDDTTVLWEGYITNGEHLPFPRGIKIAEGNACSAELAASGTGAVLGKINLHGATV